MKTLSLSAVLCTLALAMAASPARAQTYAVPPPAPPPAPGVASKAPPPVANCRPATVLRSGRLVRSVCPPKHTPQRYRPYRRYRRYPYRYRYKYRYRYRTRYLYRRCGTCYRGRTLYRHGGPYFGYDLGMLHVLHSKGPFKHLRPGALTGLHFGYNFSQVFGLQLSLEGGLWGKDTPSELGDLRGLTMWGVNIDTKFRLRKPTTQRTFIPYLSLGVGALGLRGVRHDGSIDCEKQKPTDVAFGGALNAGLGLDIYLARWAILGLKVQYKGIFASGLRCGPGAGRLCQGQHGGSPTVVHGLTAGVSVTVAGWK